MKAKLLGSASLYSPATVTATEIERVRKEVDRYVRRIEPPSKPFTGRGITICAGGVTYLANAWILIRLLRRHGCSLPIQIWHLGEGEVHQKLRTLLRPYDVEFVDATQAGERNLSADLRGWPLKAYSISKCRFEEVLAIDADNVPVRDPEYLLDSAEFTSSGAIFWSDRSFTPRTNPIWATMNVPYRVEHEFESGQMAIRKTSSWEPLQLALWMNLRWRYFYRILWGDKDTFRFAWHKFGFPFSMPNHGAPQILSVNGPGEHGVVCHPDFKGERIFQHRTAYKFRFFGQNPQVAGCLFEPHCAALLQELRTEWDGRINAVRTQAPKVSTREMRDLTRGRWLIGGLFPSDPNGPNEEVILSSGEHSSYSECSTVLKAQKPPKYRDVVFHGDGTLREASIEPYLVYWQIETVGIRRMKLLNASGSLAGILNETSHGTWKGDVRINGRWHNCEILPIEHVYPALTQFRRAKQGGAYSTASHGNPPISLTVINKSTGLGDHVTSIYACCAAADRGFDITFETPYEAWFERITHPNLRIRQPTRLRPPRDFTKVIDLDANYGIHARYASSRADWYAGSIIPGLKPRRPAKVDVSVRQKRFDFNDYAIISPFANWSCREWPEVHWTRLVELLKGGGLEVIAVSSRKQQARLARLFNKTGAFWASSNDLCWLTDVLCGASVTIGNDSGIAQFGGLLGIPTISLHAQLTPSFLWNQTTVQSITPKAECAFCHWLPARGYNAACENACSALATIGPEEVARVVLANAQRTKHSAIEK